SELYALVAEQPRAGDDALGLRWFGGELSTLGHRVVAAAEDGTFVLKGLAADAAYKVWAVERTRMPNRTEPCTAAVETPAGSKGLELRYEEGIAVRCRLVDARTGAAIEAAWVRTRLQGATQDGEAPTFRGFDPGWRGERRECPGGDLVVRGLRPKP